MLLAAVFAAVAATLAFSLVLLLGQWLLRLLGQVPEGKPETLAYEPSPPPLIANPDRQRARAMAARQARRRERGELLLHCWRQRQLLADGSACLALGNAGQAARERLAAAEAEADGLLAPLEDEGADDADPGPARAVAARLDDLVAAGEQTVVAALGPDGQRRRELVLLALLLTVSALFVVLVLVQP